MTQINPVVGHNGFSSSANVDTTTSSYSAQDWMQTTASASAQGQITSNQITSLNAMISYIASKSGQTEFRIERGLSDYFNIPNPKCLPALEFDNAIRYLVDVIEV